MIREACPVCNAAAPSRLDHRARVPVVLNRLGTTAAAAREVAQGELDIVGCTQCGFVWNRTFDPALVPYDEDYENDQTHSASFRAHVARMAEKVFSAMSVSGSLDIAEVGCGQGVFLKVLAANAGTRLHSAVGFDPAFRNADAMTDPRIRVYREYFDADSVARLETPPSVVVTRHTIEHVADPVAFLKAIREGIGDLPARLFVETPDVRWILSRGAMEDFFYEHCSLFDPHSMRLALQAAGFVPEEIETVFEDQYLWASASVNLPAPPSPLTRPNVPLPDLSRVREGFIADWQGRIAGIKPVVIWGAGAKGVTFCTLIDPDASRIAAVVDINPGKQKRFVPMTGHPVVGLDALEALKPEIVVVMNPNYREEICAMLASTGIAARVLVL